MSGQFPTDPNFRAINFKDNRPTLLNQTLSGKKQVRQIGAQYFSFTVSMPSLQQAKAQEIFAFLQKQKGMFSTFQIGYPLNNKGTSHSESDILVNGAQSAGDDDIASDGFSQGIPALSNHLPSSVKLKVLPENFFVLIAPLYSVPSFWIR